MDYVRGYEKGVFCDLHNVLWIQENEHLACYNLIV